MCSSIKSTVCNIQILSWMLICWRSPGYTVTLLTLTMEILQVFMLAQICLDCLVTSMFFFFFFFSSRFFNTDDAVIVKPVEPQAKINWSTTHFYFQNNTQILLYQFRTNPKLTINTISWHYWSWSVSRNVVVFLFFLVFRDVINLHDAHMPYRSINNCRAVLGG